MTITPFHSDFTTNDFNSHAHVERDILVDKTIEYTGISTHTLTWSVTKANLPVVEERYISTHTLTWSVTRD